MYCETRTGSFGRSEPGQANLRRLEEGWRTSARREPWVNVEGTPRQRPVRVSARRATSLLLSLFPRAGCWSIT